MITAREIQVAELICWGQSEKDIARKLYLSADTVKTHKKNLMRKIGAHNIADVTRWFIATTHKVVIKKSRFARQVISVFFLMLSLSDIAGGVDMLRTYRCLRIEYRVKTRRHE